MQPPFTGLIGPLGTLPSGLQTVLQDPQHSYYAYHQKLLMALEKQLAHLTQQAPATRASHNKMTWLLAQLRLLVATDQPAALRYVHYFSLRPRSSYFLQQIIKDYFLLPVQIRCLTVKRPLHDTNASLPAVLGRSSYMGRWFLDSQYTLQIQIGPVNLKRWLCLLPHQPMRLALEQLALDYMGSLYDIDWHLVIDPQDIVPCQVGGHNATRLGYTSWLMARD